MIQDGVVYLSILLAYVALIAFAEQKSKSKLFKVVPGIIFIYVGGALMQTFGVFGKTDSIDNTYNTVRNVLLPAMLILMLLHCDLRKIIKMGPRILLTFLRHLSRSLLDLPLRICYSKNSTRKIHGRPLPRSAPAGQAGRPTWLFCKKF